MQTFSLICCALILTCGIALAGISPLATIESVRSYTKARNLGHTYLRAYYMREAFLFVFLGCIGLAVSVTCAGIILSNV